MRAEALCVIRTTRGTEEYEAYESGIRDTRARIKRGLIAGPTNEDHLIMIGQAYANAVRATREEWQGDR